MNLLKSITYLIVTFVTLQNLSCQTKEKATQTLSLNSPTKEVTKNWPTQMQQLTAGLTELLPIINDSKSYEDKEKSTFVEAKIAELKKIAHDINLKTPTPDQDPSLKLIGQRFEDNLKLSLDSFQSGHLEFSRSVFKNALAQCVQCHTRLETGPTLAQPQFLNSLQKVAIVERVQFLIASRYFDEAMNEINFALDKGDTLSIVAWQKLVQMGLIINVRFRHNIKLTTLFLDKLSQNKNVPFFIKRHLNYWQQSVKEWNHNPNLVADLKTAKQILIHAESAQKASRSDGGAIDYLRAGGLLHQFLAKAQLPSAKSEALYELGLIYENIGEIGAWSMNEDYYDLCIHTMPHSEIAKKCFARFQESTIAGFSGTSGLNIPEDVQKKMNELHAVAL